MDLFIFISVKVPSEGTSVAWFVFGLNFSFVPKLAVTKQAFPGESLWQQKELWNNKLLCTSSGKQNASPWWSPLHCRKCPFVHYVFRIIGNRTCQPQQPLLHRKKYLHVFVHYVFKKQPFCTEESTCIHVMYLCTMYLGNRICQPSQSFCTEECTYMYLCTMYSGNRICQP